MDLTKFYDHAYEWILRVGPKLILAIVIFAAAQFLIRLLKRWMRGFMHKKEFDSSLQPFLMSLLFSILQVLAILATMQVLGIEMTIFAALVGGMAGDGLKFFFIIFNIKVHQLPVRIDLHR
jgi:small conductance mechanosensitive channel